MDLHLDTKLGRLHAQVILINEAVFRLMSALLVRLHLTTPPPPQNNNVAPASPA